MKRMITGEVITQSLIANNVDTVFGIPGAHMYDFNDALAREAKNVRYPYTSRTRCRLYGLWLCKINRQSWCLYCAALVY